MFKVGQIVIIKHLNTPLYTSNRQVTITSIGPKWITTSERIKVAKDGTGPWSLVAC